ncbi:MAG: SDR family NAD-dependent epimerase/dehydratase, partial [Pseudomonadota bacterium]
TPDVEGPVNIGNPSEITIRSLAETVVDLTGSASKLTFEPMPADDPRQRCPDIAKVQALTGWGPTTPLRVGLEKTIAYFDTLLKSNSRV